MHAGGSVQRSYRRGVPQARCGVHPKIPSCSKAAKAEKAAADKAAKEAAKAEAAEKVSRRCRVVGGCVVWTADEDDLLREAV